MSGFSESPPPMSEQLRWAVLRIKELESALREIQFLDCCYDCRVIADEALGDDG
jgi:hypothetical protein